MKGQEKRFLLILLLLLITISFNAFRTYQNETSNQSIVNLSHDSSEWSDEERKLFIGHVNDHALIYNLKTLDWVGHQEPITFLEYHSNLVHNPTAYYVMDSDYQRVNFNYGIMNQRPRVAVRGKPNSGGVTFYEPRNHVNIVIEDEMKKPKIKMKDNILTGAQIENLLAGKTWRLYKVVRVKTDGTQTRIRNDKKVKDVQFRKHNEAIHIRPVTRATSYMVRNDSRELFLDTGDRFAEDLYDLSGYVEKKSNGFVLKAHIDREKRNRKVWYQYHFRKIQNPPDLKLEGEGTSTLAGADIE